MVHIVKSDKRERIKFVDNLLEKTYDDYIGRKEDERSREKERLSIIDRIRNDTKIPAEKKENIIETIVRPPDFKSHIPTNIKIISKTDPELIYKTLKEIKENTYINAPKVIIDDKKIKEIFEK